MAVENGLVLSRVRPFTGRKHQIRVQLAHEGLPILGDPLYNRVRSYDPATSRSLCGSTAIGSQFTTSPALPATEY